MLECRHSFCAIQLVDEWPEIQNNTGGGNPLDGYRWLTLDGNSKYAYIFGFFEGMFRGHSFTTWGLPGGEKDDPSYVNAIKSYNDYWRRFVEGVTYRQFFDGLDKLYADETNRKIEIQNGMWIVMSEISGQPAAIMQSMIEAWRRKAARES